MHNQVALSFSLADFDMEEVIIVGAGVAGLACMNAFLDKGIHPLLIDAGTIGSYKLCGEFLSASVCRQLEAWDIGPIQKIDQIQIGSLTLHKNCGAMSRSVAELQLAERACTIGGRILEMTKIEQIFPGSVLLADGTILSCKKLIVATGRFGVAPKEFPYIGLKAHFEHDPLIPHLAMHMIPGGYYGIVPITASTSNIACLVKKEHLHEALKLDVDWKQAPVSSFGIKKVPNYPNTCWIGDAIASFPPATGQGCTHAIDSAFLATTSQNYNQELLAQIKYKMRLSQCIHTLMLHKKAAKAFMPFAHLLQNHICKSLSLD